MTSTLPPVPVGAATNKDGTPTKEYLNWLNLLQNTVNTNNSSSVIQIVGDASGNGTTLITVTFASVNASPGTFGSAYKVVQQTVNSKGLTTAISATPVAGYATDSWSYSNWGGL